MYNTKDIKQLIPETNNAKDLDYMFKQLVKHQNIKMHDVFLSACLFLLKRNESTTRFWAFKTSVFFGCPSRCVSNDMGADHPGEHRYTCNIALKTVYSSN